MRSAVERKRRPALERLEDIVLLATFTVTNTNDSGAGSFRFAWNSVINSDAPGTIVFNIGAQSPTTGPITIDIGSPTDQNRLPTMREPITIDAWSEGDWQNNTALGTYNGSPLIDIDGSQIPGQNGFDLGSTSDGAAGSVVEGLAMTNWTGIGTNGGEAIILEPISPNCVIQGCYIGLEPDGKTAAGNTNAGIFVSSQDNTIGGTTAADRNVISGNTSAQTGTGAGIALASSPILLTGDTPANDNLIEGNYIGTDASGNTAVPNNYGIAMVGTTGTTIGGTAANAGNVISGNTGNGVLLTSSVALLGNPAATEAAELLGIGALQTSQTVIQGNLIGTNATGTTALANAIGINLDSPTDPNNNPNNLPVDDTTIGGPGGAGANPGNLIAGNTGAGLQILGGPVNNTLVQGNEIGASGLPNGGSGIVIQSGANTNTIGGTSTGDGNTIAFNAGNGVTVGSSTSDTTTVGNDIEGNSITANTGLGISLGGGTTPLPNDSGPDGPNDLQNYPVLGTVTATSGGQLTIMGTFTEAAEPNALLTINFYGDPGDPSGNGEGAVFLGSTTIMTDGTGSAPINFTVTAPPAGDVISATATLNDSLAGLNSGDTSEFSANVTPPAATATTFTTLTVSPTTALVGAPITLSARVMQMTGAPVNVGSVEFMDGTTPLGSAQLPNDVATIMTSSLTQGVHSITAVYSGTSTFLTSTSQAQTVTVQATTSTAVTANPNPGTDGQPIAFPVTVTNTSGTATPTGTVDLMNGSALLGTGTLGATGQTTIMATLTAGPYSITADYLGDTTFQASTSTPALSLTVNPAVTATQLVVTAQPQPNPVGTGNTFSLQVSAEDSSGNVDTTFTGDVLLAILTGPSGATLGGTTNVAATAGVANFSDLTLSAAGTYTLQATFSSLTPATTGQLTVVATPITATKLVVTGEPPDTVNDFDTFSMEVSAEDASNNVDTSYDGPVTVAIATGTGTLGGTTMVNAVNGVALFLGLTLSPDGNYTLGATSDSLTPATTSQITVLPQVATSVDVTSGPTPNPVTEGSEFGLVAQIQDGFGHVVPNYTQDVTVSVEFGPGTLGGTSTATTANGLLVNGVATFSDLTLSQAGDYEIQVSSDGLETDFDIPITVTASTLPATTTTLVSSENPSTFGDTVTFTATVASQTAGTPTGSVTFLNGQTPIGTEPLMVVGGQDVATLPDSSLTGGSHTITAAYSGDDNFAPSVTTTPVNQVVNPAPTTTTIDSSTNPSIFGDSVNFVATVTAGVSGTNATGTVTFSIDGVAQTPPVPLFPVIGQDAATATFADSTLTGGSHTITAAYGGDGNFATSVTTTPVNQVVNPAPTTTAVQSSVNPSTFGQTVTFTAIVSPGAIAPDAIVSGANANAAASVLPTGTVTFTIDGTAQDPVPVSVVNGQAVATFPDSTLVVGSHTITASYSGDTNYTTSAATTPVTQVVQAVTSTTLTATPNPANVGQTITLTSTVTNTSGSGGTPIGIVDFMTGTTLIGSGTLDATGHVSITTSLPQGTYPIVADYLGATDFHSGNSPTVTLTVNALPSSTAINSAPTSTTFGQPATFAVIVSGATGGPTPTGTVTFLDDSAPIGTVPVMGGQANFTVTTLGAGAHAITAAYSGDSTYSSSTSTVAALTVAKTASTTLVSSTANPAGQGQSVTFTAVVGGPIGVTPPTGTVTFLDGTTVLGTATLNANDVATFTTSTLAAGAHPITASYSGDANFLASTSTALTQQVNSSAVVDGPTVTNLQRFGFHNQPTILVLTFSAPLDPTRAQNVANYTVTGPNAKNAVTVFYAITSAVYHPVNNTVTLRFKNRLNVHRNYVIVVNGMAPSGLTSASGVLIDGNNTGHPGSNYEKGFGRADLAGPASKAGSAAAAIIKASHQRVSAKAVDALLTSWKIHIQRHHHPKH